MDNYAVADQFSLLSRVMDIHGENSFKIKTYSIAAFNIEKLEVQLSQLPKEKIFHIKGIGDSIGKKVIEILETGDLALLKDYIQKTPPGVIEMLAIKGLGPKKINIIWKELEIESLGELLYACNENRLLLSKSFGKKTQDNIRDSIMFYMQNLGSYLYAQIETYAHRMDQKLKESFSKYQAGITGTFRRQMETIDLLEWCTTAPPEELKIFFSKNNFDLVQESKEHLLFKDAANVEIKLHLASRNFFYIKLFSTSCSAEFLTAWEKPGEAKNKVNYESEEMVFETAGYSFIPPYLREKENILKKAKSGKLPEPIEVSDVKAIIHSHSNWSDGINTIEEMANDLIKRKFEYLVISDHSKSAYYAKGLTEERVSEQHKYIDELNQKLAPFKIFKGIECDILNDGSLDYTNDILASFDVVIASVHSNLKMTEEKAMARLLNAISNPYVIILGHMTGRLLLSRNGFPIDHREIIETCAANNVIIELNAHPRRLDMDWRWIDYALEKGVLISIDPDAHDVSAFDDIRYGVLAAQKAGLTREQNVSSFSLVQFESYLQKIRTLKGIN